MNSDKQYRITLTEKQLALVEDAVELMMRTGMGQTYSLAEWIACPGDNMTNIRELDISIAQRNLIKGVLDGIMREIQIPPRGTGKSDPVQELTTLYEAIGHQQWLDSGRSELDARSCKPMQCGTEPVPAIEKVDDENT